MYRSLILIFMIGVESLYHQNDYKLNYERLEIHKSNPEFLRNFTIINYKYNRTVTLTNATFTFLNDFNRNIYVIAQAYKFMSNEYRLFPIRFQFSLCNVINDNDFGLERIYGCGNLTRCPMKKGTYVVCKFSPEESRFPPHIPSGQYMIELTGVYFSTEIALIHAYGTIYRPLKGQLRSF